MSATYLVDGRYYFQAVGSGTIDDPFVPALTMSNKNIQKFLCHTVTRNTSGDGSAILAAPGAGYKYIISSINVSLLDPATSVSVILKMGNQTFPTYIVNSTRDGVGLSMPVGGEYHLAENTAVFVNLSANVAVGVVVFYAIEEA